MLGIQLDFEGNKVVVKDGVAIGLLSENCLDPFKQFSEINNYYKGIFNHILNQIDRAGYEWYKGGNIVGGDLVVSVTREGKSILDVFYGSLESVDRYSVVINYLRCKKVYIIKPSIKSIKIHLHKVGVIK